MRAHFGLPSVVCEDTEGKPPIQVKFEIPYFTTSGIQVILITILRFRDAFAFPQIARSNFRFYFVCTPTGQVLKDY